VYLLAFTWIASTSEYETWGAFVIGPVLVMLALPMIRLAGRSLDAPWFAKMAFAALLLKMGGALARYWVAFVVYGGSADAAGYHGWGKVLAAQYASGNFAADIGRELIGTGFIRMLTGLIYVVTGPSLVGGYLVYSWIGFWGLVLAIRAFRIALPEGDLRRYSLLIFFLPSMLFWPSGLGKEAWMMVGVGLAMYGAARLLTSGYRGLLPLLFGLGATYVVRPHVTVLLVGALLAAVAFRPSTSPGPLTPLLKGGALLLVGGLAALAVFQAADFLGVEEISVENLRNEYETANEGTAQGGSKFGGAAVTNPLMLPWAVVSVLVRPFPWEAGGLLPLLSSLEGVLLLVLAWQSRRRILGGLRMLRSQPYVLFAVSYLVLFVLVFSGFSNFGILVRQRSLVLPAFLVLLALPAPWASLKSRRDRRSTDRAAPRGRTLQPSGKRTPGVAP
jgi:hypothetical protein